MWCGRGRCLYISEDTLGHRRKESTVSEISCASPTCYEFLPKKTNNDRTRLCPNSVFRLGRSVFLSKLIYACFAGSGSAFLDFLLNGLRISSFTLPLKCVLLAIGVLGTYR